jgi:inhibitor of cysteine peptidase
LHSHLQKKNGTPVFIKNRKIIKVITENYNGKTVQIKQGDSFCLRLEENPSTGYSWQLNLSKGLGLLSTKYYPQGSSKSNQRLIVGSAGLHFRKPF